MKKQEIILSNSKLSNCEFIKGETLELINSAKIVIGFNTTALIESLILKNIILYFDIKNKIIFKTYT